MNNMTNTLFVIIQAAIILSALANPLVLTIRDNTILTIVDE